MATAAHTFRSARFALIILAFVLLLHGVCWADTAGEAPAELPEALQKKILDAKAGLQQEIKKAEDLLTGAAGEEEQRLYTELIDQLQKIDIVYEQQLVQVKRSPELSQTLEQLKQEMAGETGQAGEPSYPFSYLDELGDKLFLLEEQAGSFAEELKTADESYLTAREKLKGKEQDFRRIREDHEKRNEDPLRAPAVVVAQWSRLLAEEELELRKLFMENERIEHAIHQLKITTLRSRIAAVKGRVRFTREEFDGQLSGIDQEIAELKNRLEQAKEKKGRAELRWQKAAKQPAREDQSPADAQVREKEIESLKLWYDAGNGQVMLAGQLISFRNDLKKLRQYRYELFHNTPLVDMPGWQKEISQGLKQLEQVRQKASGVQAGCLNEIIVRNESLASADRVSKISYYLEEQIRALKEREGLAREFLEAVQKMEWEYKRLLADIQSGESRISLGQRINRYGVVLSRVWRYELTSVDDHPITAGKVITAVLLLLIGYFLSKRLTLQMGKQLKQRFAVDEAAAFAWQQIAHYLLLVLLLLFVLHLVRIPLTFFTVVGGALAIGVGFGSQTIVNNFLSGLILMLERPIKIGDIVEVEQVSGTVEWVGARSTRIKTFDNLRLVVPNSAILQNKIINWSLTDDIVRRSVTVGVMYGSPVRKVEQLLLQAADEQRLVERYPEPQVFFEEFGESALIFVLLIWVSLVRTGKSQTSLKRVESDIRFRVDELFRQEGIVMAYPQRDLHIDSLKPIEVRLKGDDRT
jgi:small-conductance mechanosensitive channel